MVIKTAKRGWFKVFEATVACLLILGIFLFVFNQNKLGSEDREEIQGMIESVLRTLATDEDWRLAVLNNNSSALEEYFENNIEGFFNWSFSVCELEESCLPESDLDFNVFVASRVVSMSVEAPSYSPKQIVLFVRED